MGKYTRRKDGRFETKINTGNFDETGRPIRVPVYGNSEAELKRNIATVRNELSTGTYIKDKKMTLRSYADHWLKTYKEGQVETATYKKYKSVVRNYIKPIEKMPLVNIRKSDVQQIINEQSSHPDNQRMIKMTMNQIFESAIEDEYLCKNVAKNIKLPKPIENEDPIRPPFTNYELEVIRKVKTTLSPMQKFYIDTLFVSGMRPEEVLALMPNDISSNQIRVNKALTWRGHKSIKAPKSKAAYRTIDVPEWYQIEANEYISTCDSLYMFHNKDKSVIGSSPYRKMWGEIYDKMNVEMHGTNELKICEISAYRFRHNYCTMLYKNGVDVKECQRIMGHSDIRITMNIYTHLDKMSKSVANKISGIAL